MTRAARDSTIPAVLKARSAPRQQVLRSSGSLLRNVLIALFAATLGVASAGAGVLGQGDAQLASGEYYDRVTFQGASGDRVVIEITSTAFDPYLIILDQNDNVLFEEDDSQGVGLNVRTEFQLPSSGSFTIVITSAVPGETGGYSLTLAAVDQASSPAGGKTVPAPSAPAQPGPGGAGQSGSSGSVNTQPGTVTGTVVDTQGRPIAGARVWIEPALTTGVVELRTDAQGRYTASSLIDVPYNAKAWAYVEYGGRQVCLRMGMESPVDYDSFVPTRGAVRNFRWQLTGPIEDLRGFDEYFGGMLRVMNTFPYNGQGQLEFTFTPTGPRIDGSTVQAFTRTLDPRNETDIYDLPVGPYRVTAVLVGSDGSRRPVQLGPDYSDYSRDFVDIDWSGDGTCSNANGLDWVYAYLHIPE